MIEAEKFDVRICSMMIHDVKAGTQDCFKWLCDTVIQPKGSVKSCSCDRNCEKRVTAGVTSLQRCEEMSARKIMQSDAGCLHNSTNIGHQGA